MIAHPNFPEKHPEHFRRWLSLAQPLKAGMAGLHWWTCLTSTCPVASARYRGRTQVGDAAGCLGLLSGGISGSVVSFRGRFERPPRLLSLQSPLHGLRFDAMAALRALSRPIGP